MFTGSKLLALLQLLVAASTSTACSEVKVWLQRLLKSHNHNAEVARRFEVFQLQLFLSLARRCRSVEALKTFELAAVPLSFNRCRKNTYSNMKLT
jgi:hypothetical protein